MVVRDRKLVILRLRNRQISLSKTGDGKGNTLVLVTFARAKAWEESKAPEGMVQHHTDMWMRGKSKFNLSISHLAIGQDSLVNVFDMMFAYQKAFEAPKSKIEIVKP